MAYFSRFPMFQRPRWGYPMPMRQQPHPLQAVEKVEDNEPFIPPNFDSEEEEELDDDEPGSGPGPSTEEQYAERPPKFPRAKLIPLKVYRYRSAKGDWKHFPVSGLHDDTSRRSQESRGRPPPPCSQVRIISWNIDMASPMHEQRLEAALRHIEEEVLGCKDGGAPEACVILLQEVRDVVLPYLLRDPWVRRWFAVTPFTKEKWPEYAHYGNVTLVSRTLDIAESHILHFGCTNMQRSAVCVKLKLNYPGSYDKVVVAFVNTHLESLPVGIQLRPKQLEMSSRFLLLEGVQGGIIAGDMNCICPEDATIPKDLGLKDSWRKGNDEKGNTWGYQGQNEGRHPPGRLDKVFYLPGMGYRVEESRKIGIGLKIDEGTPQAMWVSDHYGLDTKLRIKGRSQSS
ncbi:hypothetical protein BDN70DRAFT_888383 [Pholiota conissans]|uniref:Endonuclease/exonuclease/phosphatase domain-containing protein n=1 Tax=Pholiota conissans TaxID=109636 RepID=A0A9P5YNV2_9AGAR|nr:hypothetical protein BDN70DRAFT_888383 [Pholiota conissans]